VFVVGALKTGFKVKTVWTGQHWDYKLYGSFLKELDIPKPEYALKIDDNAYGPRLGKMIAGISKVVNDYKPDCIVVYGDCDTTLAGALAGRRLGVPVAHIEAGLRSGDMLMPEEVNRILVDEIADYCFATTTQAAANLAVEGVRGNVYVSGDITKDLLEMFLEKSKEIPVISDMGLVEKCYYFATIHRAENTASKQRLKDILSALGALDLPVVLPLHPRTAKRVKEWGLAGLLAKGKIQIIQPVGYLESLRLQEGAKKVITDSGGIQKEAYMLGVPCVTIRDTTEYPETCFGNWNCLCPDVKWLPNFVELTPNKAHYKGLFGDGYAVMKVCEILKGLE